MTSSSTLQCNETPFGEYVEGFITPEEMKKFRKSLFAQLCKSELTCLLPQQEPKRYLDISVNSADFTQILMNGWRVETFQYRYSVLFCLTCFGQVMPYDAMELD